MKRGWRERRRLAGQAPGRVRVILPAGVEATEENPWPVGTRLIATDPSGKRHEAMVTADGVVSAVEQS